MTRPFSQWSQRIEAAVDERSRRQLLGEIGLWRAKNLMDVAAQRSASWALSEIYHALGEAQPAANEADQLVSLCQATPEASLEELRFAEQHARRISGRTPGRVEGAGERGGRGERPSRSERSERSERTDRPPRGERGRAAEATVHGESGSGLDAAVAAARDGRWSDARTSLGEPRGPRGLLVSVWIELAALLESGLTDDGVRGVVERVSRAVSGRGGAASEAAQPQDDLSRLIGRPVPTRREAMLDVLDAWLAEHPTGADELASTALRRHVETQGPRSTAPWLAGYIGRALVSGGTATRALLDAMQADGVWSVTAYAEEGFVLLVEVARLVQERGGEMIALRRGVLHQGEPADRRIWTLRVRLADGGERLVAVAPTADEAWDDAVAARVARRISELADRPLVVAEGSGNAGLRAACIATGAVSAEAPHASAIVAQLAEIPGRRRQVAPAPNADGRPEPRRRGEGRPEGREPGAEAAAEGRGEGRSEPRANPLGAIAALFGGAEIAPAEAYAPHLAELRRVFKAFAPVRRVLAERELEDADARLEPVLRAVHAAAPEGVRLAEGITLAIRCAAQFPGGRVEALLLGGDDAAARFGGPGIAGLLDVVRAIKQAGGRVERVLTGLSRRERDLSPVLAALSGGLGGLWRLLVGQEGRRGEVWWLTDLTPEGQAAGVQLLLDVRPRVVVVAEGDEGLVPTVGDALVLANGDLSSALQERMAAWPERVAGADEGEPEES